RRPRLWEWHLYIGDGAVVDVVRLQGGVDAERADVLQAVDRDLLSGQVLGRGDRAVVADVDGAVITAGGLVARRHDADGEAVGGRDHDRGDVGESELEAAPDHAGDHQRSGLERRGRAGDLLLGVEPLF